MLHELRKTPKSFLIFISAVTVIIFALSNFFFGAEFSLIQLYFFPIVIVTLYLGVRIGLLFSILTTALQFFVELFGHFYSQPAYLFLNGFKRLLIFLAVVELVRVFTNNYEVNLKNKKIIKQGHHIVEIFQRITIIMAQNITRYNSNLLYWMARKRENGHTVPSEVETNCKSIGESLKVLSEVAFEDPNASKELELDDLVGLLEKRLNEVEAMHRQAK